MLNTSMLESTILRLIRTEDLNHHGTLFAGQMAKWVLEAGVITAARLIGRPEDIVCAQLNSMTFRKPVNNGDVVEIKSRIAYLGSSSIVVHSQILRNQEPSPVVSNMTTFVTVDKQNRPYAHGLSLPEEYIAQHRDIYDEALRDRRARQ